MSLLVNTHESVSQLIEYFAKNLNSTLSNGHFYFFQIFPQTYPPDIQPIHSTHPFWLLIKGGFRVEKYDPHLLHTEDQSSNKEVESLIGSINLASLLRTFPTASLTG